MRNVVYHTSCPNKKYTSHYRGQTKCRIGKRALQHNKLDKNSHLLKHANKTKHKRVWLEDFKIIGCGYRSDFKRRISSSSSSSSSSKCSFFHGMSPKVFRTLVPSTVLFVVCRGSAVLLEVNIVPLFRETISIASST